MPQNGKKSADQVLLLALACGATPEAAARQAGVSARTVFRRLADPGFKAQLQKLQADMVHRSMGTLVAMYGEAARGLLELIKSTAPPAVRLGPSAPCWSSACGCVSRPTSSNDWRRWSSCRPSAR